MSFKVINETTIVRQIFEVWCPEGFCAKRYKEDLARVPDDAVLDSTHEDTDEFDNRGARLRFVLEKAPESREEGTAK